MKIEKSILIISFTNLKNDPRVFRQIFNLNSSDYKIFALGLEDPQIKGVTFLKVIKNENLLKKIFNAVLLLFGIYEFYYWNQKVIKLCLKITKDINADLIIANDLDSLPLASKLKSQWKSKMIFDAHEYSPKEHDDKFIWRLLFQKLNIYLLKKYTSFVDKMITVCDGIAEEYFNNFGIRPIVVNNATEYFDIKLKEVTSNKIKLIHHGGSIVSRKIENMIYMMDYLDERFSLDLMLVPTHNQYHKMLLQMVDKRTNVKIINPVPMKDIVSFISNYDIGLYILEPTNFNNGMALPNKIFEFIQARLAVAIGPSPEMKSLIQKLNIGIISDDFSPKSLAVKLNQLNKDQINNYKRNSNTAARFINSDENIKILKNIVNELI